MEADAVTQMYRLQEMLGIKMRQSAVQGLKSSDSSEEVPAGYAAAGWQRLAGSG